ncbi:hypothetical protein C8Q79DRAFT_693675 [Trametes meyenii]|nr:hypothetical protein C8Q79DRAFT_693675 [Trametes meyenii]
MNCFRYSYGQITRSCSCARADPAMVVVCASIPRSSLRMDIRTSTLLHGCRRQPSDQALKPLLRTRTTADSSGISRARGGPGLASAGRGGGRLRPHISTARPHAGVRPQEWRDPASPDLPQPPTSPAPKGIASRYCRSRSGLHAIGSPSPQSYGPPRAARTAPYPELFEV